MSSVETEHDFTKEQTPLKTEQGTIKTEHITIKEEQIPVEIEQVTIKTEIEEQIPVKIEPIDNGYEVNISQENALKQHPYEEINENVVAKIVKVEQEPLEIVFEQNSKEKGNLIQSCNLPIEHIEIKIEKVNEFQEQKSGKIQLRLEKGPSTKSTPKKKQSQQENSLEPSTFECEVCHKIFKSLKCLKRHTPSHDAKRYSCEFCTKTYKRGLSLSIHIRRHTGEMPYICDYCSYKTHTRLSIITHIRIHTGETPFSCQLCKESFRTRSSLNAHKKREHGILSKKHTFLKECHLCQKVIKSACTYKKHMNKHLGIGPVCDICNKKFSAKGALRTHMQKHMGIRNFPCNVCDKSFFTKSHLKCHIRAHEDKKPYACNLCGLRFNQRYHLNAHLLVHEKNENRKRYTCAECEKSFLSKNYMMKHIMSVHNAKIRRKKKQKK